MPTRMHFRLRQKVCSYQQHGHGLKRSTVLGLLAVCGLALGSEGALAAAQGTNPLLNAQLGGTFEKLGSEGGGRPGNNPGGAPGYLGPGDTVPPGGGTGLPPAGSGGGTSGGDSGTGSGAGGTGFGGPSQPGIGATPVSATPQPAAVSGSGILAAGLFDWRTVWDLYRRRTFAERLFQNTGSVATGSTDLFLGLGRDVPLRAPTPRVSEDDLVELIAPRLLEMARPEESNLVRLEALLALGRISGRLSGPLLDQLASTLRVALKDGAQAVSEGAAIGLGMAADPRSAPLLVDLLRDTKAGRDACGRTQVPERLRAFAGYSLAFLARVSHREDVRRYAVHHLEFVLDHEREAALPDVVVAALYGMALVPVERIDLVDPAGRPEPASASRLAGIRRILAELDSSDRHDHRLRDHVPSALARLIADLPSDRRGEMLALVAGPLQKIGRNLGRERQTFRTGVAFALGAMLSCGDGPAGEGLREMLLDLCEDPNSDTRQASRLAVGRILGRTGSGPEARANQEELATWLLRDLVRGRSSDRAYSALGLGLAAEARRLEGLSVPSEWSSQLETELREANGPDNATAIASACGLTGSKGLEESLLAAFHKAPDGEPRARIAFAMGLAGTRGAIEPLEDWLETRKGDRVSIARGIEALALLGAQTVLTDAKSNLKVELPAVQAAGILDGLGRTGDARALEALLRSTDENRVDLVRAAAARSLGALADWDPSPWCEDLADVANLTAGVSTLFDFGGGGLLDLIEY